MEERGRRKSQYRPGVEGQQQQQNHTGTFLHKRTWRVAISKRTEARDGGRTAGDRPETREEKIYLCKSYGLEADESRVTQKSGRSPTSFWVGRAFGELQEDSGRRSAAEEQTANKVLYKTYGLEADESRVLTRNRRKLCRFSSSTTNLPFSDIPEGAQTR